MNNDLYLRMLNDLHNQMDDHKKDTRILIDKVDDLQSTVTQEVSQLKLSQAKCENKWAISEKVFGWTIGSGSLLGLLSWMFSSHSGK